MTITMTIFHHAPPPMPNPQHLTPKSLVPKKNYGISYFTRPELQSILDIYARQVALGEWRDYAIDHQANQAFFSIYRSSFESPLYTIGKIRLKGHNRWLYTLNDRRKCVKSASNLIDILDRLERLPRLVSG